MLNKKEVLAEAMNLSPNERAQLVEELLSDLDLPERKQLDRLWGSESESRINAYEQDDLAATPLETVFEKINAWKK